MTQPVLHLLYENDGQIRRNAFVFQLYETLDANFQVVPTSRDELLAGQYEQPGEGVLALSLLRQRSWRRVIPFLARYADRCGIYLYDQDPWEAYHDKASSPGTFAGVASMVNVRAYLITSDWWARYIRETDNVPVKFVRMGILPRLCDIGKPFGDRSHEVGFQGTVHGHRREFFDRMKARGVDVACLERRPFLEFLETIQDVGIFLYDDSAAITMGGKPASFHGLWGKCLTVAGRGCYVIRNHDLSYGPYQIDELPTVFTFENEEEVPAIVEKIRAMSEQERNDAIVTTVNRIKERNDWMSVVRALTEDAG